MRNFFIIMISMMFIAGHSLSGWAQPVHSGVIVSLSTQSSEFAPSSTPVPYAWRNVSQSEIKPLVANGRGAAGLVDAIGAVHCQADCGVALPEAPAGPGDGRIDLVLRANPANIPTSQGDRFRPPIA